MNFDQLIDRPDKRTLQSVIAGRQLKFIAPFVRRGALDYIVPLSHDMVKLIVRLPRTVNDPLVRLDNDPRDLIDLIDRMGPKIRIFALPGVHTKLYLNGVHAYYGSANFTSTGFGGKPESLLSTTDPATYQLFQEFFDRYLSESTRVTMPYLNVLRRRLELGEIEYTSNPEHPDSLTARKGGDDVADFRNWLAELNELDGDYIEDRFDPAAGYNMGGHVQSAFPGLRQFLRENLDLIPSLARQHYTQRTFWQQNPEPIRRLRDFVILKGHGFPANGGGAWRYKLPPFLGGPGPNGGGKGSGLIARMLIYLSRYAIHAGF